MNALIVKLRQEKEQEEEVQKKNSSTFCATTFDEDAFDESVALDISDIHRYSGYEGRNRRYKKWCIANLEDLKAMYLLSEMECDFNCFCSFVYQSGSIEPR